METRRRKTWLLDRGDSDGDPTTTDQRAEGAPQAGHPRLCDVTSIRAEADAVAQLGARLNGAFARAVEMVLACPAAWW